MTQAGEPHLAVDVVLAERVPPAREVRRLDVEVLQPVRDEHARLDVGRIEVGSVAVIAIVPELRVLAGLVAVVGGHLVETPVAVDVFGTLAGDVSGQVRRVVVRERQPLIARVVVPRTDRGDRDDRLEALHSRRGNAVGERAVVRLADHADLAVGPAGTHLLTVPVDGSGAPVQPVDHRLHRQDVGVGAFVGASGRARRTRHIDRDVCVPTGYEVVVVVQRELLRSAPRVVELDLGFVAAPAAGVVGARVHHDRYLCRAGQLARSDDVGGDLLGFAVAVEIGRLDPHALADRPPVVVGRFRRLDRFGRCRSLRRLGHSGGWLGRRVDGRPEKPDREWDSGNDGQYASQHRDRLVMGCVGQR